MGLPNGRVIGRTDLLRATDLWPAEESITPSLFPSSARLADNPILPKKGTQTRLEASSRNLGGEKSMLA